MTSVTAAFSLYDLHLREVISNPWPHYRWLLNQPGPYWDSGTRSWLVARHRDVYRLLADPNLTAAMDHRPVAKIAPAWINRRWFELLDAHVSFSTNHAMLRRVLSWPFKREAVTDQSFLISKVALRAVRKGVEAGRMDVITDLAGPIPLTVMQAMLELADLVTLDELRRWSNAWGAVVAAPGHLLTSRSAVVAHVDEFIGFLDDFVANYRPSLRGTVTELLVQSGRDGTLSGNEVIAGLMMLVTAGTETTGNLIGNCVAALLDQPRLAALLRADRDLIPQFVDEIARRDSATQYTARRALVDLHINGQQVHGGQSVVLLLAAANRDPAAFPDPDAILLDRPSQPMPVGFGHGSHFCFGAPLARLETRLALDHLLSQDIEPAGERVYRPNGNLRGLSALPINLKPLKLK